MAKINIKRRLSYIEYQKIQTIESNGIHEDLIDCIFNTAMKQPLATLCWHKTIIVILLSLGSTSIGVGIKICVASGEFDRMLGNVPTHYHTHDGLKNIKTHQHHRLEDHHDVTAKFFGWSQVFITIGIIMIIVGVVAVNVLRERISEIKRHVVIKTWCEVILPNVNHLRGISASYTRYKKIIDGEDIDDFDQDDLEYVGHNV